jgi:PAS domain S-box-containing protein
MERGHGSFGAVGDTDSDLRAQLEAAQAITHIGSWRWDLPSGVVTWSDEMYRIYGFEPRSRPITLEFFLSRVHPEERSRIRREVDSALARRGRFAYRELIVRPDGSIRTLDTVGEVHVDAHGSPNALLGTCRDITESRRAQVVAEGEQRALEMLASGASIADILEVIVRAIEAASDGVIASILLVDASGMRLVHGAAPGLPGSYQRAIDGSLIGPCAGSCGTAAFRREPVYVADITTDPLWTDYRQLATPHGLRACWSSPVRATDGRVLGTFALYRREPGPPDDAARALMARATHVTAIVLERRALDDQLRAFASQIEAIREDERTKIAREIHDELGQALTALKLDIGWLARRIQDAPVARKLGEMSKTADEVLRSVRRISSDLRPGVLEHLGLHAAIEWQAEEFAQRTGTPCEVASDIGDLELDRELTTTLFRIFQEALTNIARHASAHRVEVAVKLKHGSVVLEVADDGIGLPEVGPRERTFGILGMGERARRLGGDCAVKRRGARGTLVSVTIPLRFPADRFADQSD